MLSAGLPARGGRGVPAPGSGSQLCRGGRGVLKQPAAARQLVGQAGVDVAGDIQEPLPLPVGARVA
jgi:hypothetical protein